MTTITYITTGLREGFPTARRRAKDQKQARARAAATGVAAAKTITQRISGVWLTLIALGLASTAAWQYATWAGLLATGAACFIGERVLGIGD